MTPQPTTMHLSIILLVSVIGCVTSAPAEHNTNSQETLSKFKSLLKRSEDNKKHQDAVVRSVTADSCPTVFDDPCIREDCSRCQKTCALNGFWCKTSKKCIYSSWECNARDDCGDLEDELSCTLDQGVFVCASGDEVTKAWWACDGIVDCKDGSDESTDYCVACNANSGELIAPEWVCDGEVDCTQVCDDEGDCSGGEDEEGCSTDRRTTNPKADEKKALRSSGLLRKKVTSVVKRLLKMIQ